MTLNPPLAWLEELYIYICRNIEAQQVYLLSSVILVATEKIVKFKVCIICISYDAIVGSDNSWLRLDTPIENRFLHFSQVAKQIFTFSQVAAF